MQAHSARRGTVAVISLRGRRPDSSAAGDLTRAGTSAVFKYLSPLNAKKTKGIEILQDPLWNKGSAFTGEERERLGIRGLLPPVVKTLEQQRDGFLRRLAAEPDDLHKNLMLQVLYALTSPAPPQETHEQCRRHAVRTIDCTFDLPGPARP